MTATISVDTWDIIYRVSYCVIIGSLFVSCVATTVNYVASNQISADLTERLGLANKTAGEANERAASLESDAAKAHERTAALEVEAGRLRLALDATKAEAARIGQGLASRHLSAPQEALIASALRGKFFSILVFVENAGDAELVEYAQEIILAFRQAGLVVEVNGATRYPVPIGMTVVDSANQSGSDIATALAAAQIDFDFVRGASPMPMPMIRIGAKKSNF